MTSKSAGHARHDDKDLAEAARKSVEQIWQAGLGAFARARDEGEEMFSRLVDEGVAVQKRTRQFAEDRFEDMNATITKMADSFGKQASGSLDKLENVFEDRVTRSLQRLGVPTHADIEGLSRQLAKLQETLDAMAGKKTGQKGTQKAAPRPAKTASARTATRTSGKRSTSVSARA